MKQRNGSLQFDDAPELDNEPKRSMVSLPTKRIQVCALG